MLRNNQDPRIEYHSVVCHGDLRCSNILLQVKHNDQVEPFLIDYGLTGPNHPLSDFPRLEADLLLRVGLKSSHHRDLLNVVLEWETLNPIDASLECSLPLLGILSRIRKTAGKLADFQRISTDPAFIYRLYLLGNAVRFLRRDDPELRIVGKRHDYLWFVLSLAKRIMALESGEAPSNLSLPLGAEAIQDIQACGVVDFYWGPKRRNQSKREVILNHSCPIRLIAHTGKSYLDDTYTADGKPNGRFFADLVKRLETDPDVQMQIVLLNPYSVEGSKLGIAEARGSLRGPELDVEYHERSTELFKRFKTCLESYKSLHEHYPNLQLRISHYSTDATILMSNEVAFIEPYLIGRLSMRYTGPKYMNAPELLVQRDSEMYHVAEEQFKFLWERAFTVDEYESRIDDFKHEFMRSERLRRKVVALHDSWFALDPIVGCPSRCDYCFLTPYQINNKPPFIYRSVQDAYDRLKGYHLFVWQQSLLQGCLRDDPRLPVPLACGNYTEMTDRKYTYSLILPDGRTRPGITNFDQLKYLVVKHSEFIGSTGQNQILCLISKQPLYDELLNFLELELDRNKELRIGFFISLSFLPAGIEQTGHQGQSDLVPNFKLLSELNRKVGGGVGRNRRVAGIHYWRPLIPGLNSERLEENLQLVRENGATSSVAVGLKLSKRLLGYVQLKGGLGGKNVKGGARYRFDLPDYIKKQRSGEYFDQRLRENVLSAGKTKDHFVFLNTSCALSQAFGQPDYNAMFDGSSPPAQDIVEEVMHMCGIPRDCFRVRNESKYGRNRFWLSINGDIEQEKETFIRQMLGVEIEARVIATHEWRGNVSELTFGSTCRESHCPRVQREICHKFYSSRCS